VVAAIYKASIAAITACWLGGLSSFVIPSRCHPWWR